MHELLPDRNPIIVLGDLLLHKDIYIYNTYGAPWLVETVTTPGRVQDHTIGRLLASFKYLVSFLLQFECALFQKTLAYKIQFSVPPP